MPLSKSDEAQLQWSAALVLKDIFHKIKENRNLSVSDQDDLDTCLRKNHALIVQRAIRALIPYCQEQQYPDGTKTYSMSGYWLKMTVKVTETDNTMVSQVTLGVCDHVVIYHNLETTTSGFTKHECLNYLGMGEQIIMHHIMNNVAREAIMVKGGERVVYFVEDLLCRLIYMTSTVGTTINESDPLVTAWLCTSLLFSRTLAGPFTTKTSRPLKELTEIALRMWQKGRSPITPHISPHELKRLEMTSLRLLPFEVSQSHYPTLILATDFQKTTHQLTMGELSEEKESFAHRSPSESLLFCEMICSHTTINIVRKDTSGIVQSSFEAYLFEPPRLNHLQVQFNRHGLSESLNSNIYQVTSKPQCTAISYREASVNCISHVEDGSDILAVVRHQSHRINRNVIFESSCITLRLKMTKNFFDDSINKLHVAAGLVQHFIYSFPWFGLYSTNIRREIDRIDDGLLNCYGTTKAKLFHLQDDANLFTRSTVMNQIQFSYDLQPDVEILTMCVLQMPALPLSSGMCLSASLFNDAADLSILFRKR